MNRILEIIPTPEDAVVSRVLVLVHRAIDEHFPGIEGAGRQFRKTVFSDTNSERTMIVPGQINTDPGSQFVSGENTLSSEKTKEVTKETTREQTREYNTDLNPINSQMGTQMDHLDDEGMDWVSHGLIALLIAGIVVFFYVLFS